MIRYCLVLALLLNMRQGHAQNLVINPGFETYNKDVFSKTCKFIFTTGNDVDGWCACGSNAEASSHQCSSTSMYLSSMNLGVKPHGGKWMIGFTCIRYPEGNNEREYLIGRSNKLLRAGSTYQLSFFLSPRDGCVYGIKELGVLFTDTITPDQKYNTDFTQSPQLSISTAEITQKGQWYKIETNFVATGGEQYFIIGNFNSDSTTQTVQLGPDSKHADHWGQYIRTFYFIDDVELIETESTKVPTLYIKD